MEQAQKQWGLTQPISASPPSQADLVQNEGLLEELKRQNNFESAEDTQKRISALQVLQKVTEEFVRQAMTRKGKFSQAAIKAAGGKIFPFGSYKLGCHGPGSDIDTLVVAPNAVTRDDFFELFPKILEQTAPAGSIAELTPVPTAFIPIITLKLFGIDVDASFVGLSVSSVPKDFDLRDDNILRGLDDRQQKSVNGPRVADQILQLVPEPSVFKTALRAIKLWGQRRAIYANIMGFPGGVAWAILVARVCQLYPRAAASRVVSKFFWIMYRWQWPDPVQLKIAENGPPGIPVIQWNPHKNRGDAFHLMPVITPAFPSMNSTYNIFNSTLTIIKKELIRASQICDQVSQDKVQWKELFAKHTFFTEGYRHYLCVTSTSRTQEAQQSWSGTVESKVRLLAREVEKEEAVELAHPYVKGFERVHTVQNESQLNEVTEGGLKYQVKDIQTETTDQTNDARHKAAAELGENNVTVEPVKSEDVVKSGEEGKTLYTTTYYIGLQINQSAAVQLDVSWAIGRFKEFCTGHDEYKEGVNYVFVHHTRNFDLPDDVFSEGEKKPAKKKKSARKANGEPNGAAVKKQKLEDGTAVTAKR